MDSLDVTRMVICVLAFFVSFSFFEIQRQHRRSDLLQKQIRLLREQIANIHEEVSLLHQITHDLADYMGIMCGEEKDQ